MLSNQRACNARACLSLAWGFKLSAWAIEIPFLTCEKKVGCACLWCVINKGKNTENVGTALPEKGSPLGFLNLEPVLLFSHLKYYRKEKVSANLLILEVSFCLSFSLTPCVHVLVSQGENWHTKHHIERKYQQLFLGFKREIKKEK